MGYKNWAAGDPLLAADLMSYLMNQSVISCTSSTRPSLSVEGVFIYETDTDKFYVYNGGWVQFGASGAWTTWTPAITQVGTVTHSATYSRYIRHGRLITAEALLGVTAGVAGTGANDIAVSLPVTAAQGSNMAIGSGYIFDSSATTNYPAICIAPTTSTLKFVPSSAAGTGQLGSAVMTAGLATGDAVTFSVTYEAAAGL